MNKLTFGSFILLAGVALSGCNTTTAGDPNIRNYSQDTVSNVHPRARLVLASQDLIGRIAMVDVRMGSVGQLQRAEVSVQNLSNDRYSLEYMYSWEDKQGFGINSNKVWKRFVLAPREIKSFQTVATNPDGYAITMTVRLPDDIFIHQEKTAK